MAEQKIKLPTHVNGFYDSRLERWRYLLRLPGQKAKTLKGLPWSPTMMAGIEAAMEGRPIPSEVAVAIGATRTKSGTLNDAVVRFYDHELFTNLGRENQKRHRQKLEKFRQEKTIADDVPRGERQLHTLTNERLSKIVSEVEGAHAQRHLLNALRALMKFCKISKLIDTDPTEGLKGKKLPKTGGFKRATEDEIALYQKHHALGTKPRLALEIILNTGLRRGDTVRVGRQHLRDGVITLKPRKTEAATGVTVAIPVHSDLQAALDAMPRQSEPGEAMPLTFLHTKGGKAYSDAGFGNWFREQCVAAGVEFRAHGLRKAICVRLVGLGMTPHQIAAITGHTDLREIELYAEEFNRALAAKQSMAALEKRSAAQG